MEITTRRNRAANPHFAAGIRNAVHTAGAPPRRPARTANFSLKNLLTGVRLVFNI
jgi:hypothetical protein